MAKLFRTGNSLAVTVPSFFVHALGLKPGDTVRVRSQVGRGQIIYQFSGIHQLPLVEDLLFQKRKKK